MIRSRLKSLNLLISIIICYCCSAQKCSDLNNWMKRFSNTVSIDSALKISKQAALVCSCDSNKAAYIISLNNLSSIYSGIGQKDSALKYIALAADRYSFYKIKNDVFYSQLLINLGDAFDDLGMHNEALSRYNIAEKLLDSISKANPAASYLTDFYIICLKSIGLTNKELARYDQAVAVYNKIFEIVKEYKGINTETNINISNDYAALLFDIGDYDSSIYYYEKGISLFSNSFNIDSLIYTKLLNNVAGVYKEEGQYERAIPLYENVYTIRKRRYQGKYKYYAAAVNNLANAYMDVERYDEALKLFEEALKIRSGIDANKTSSEYFDAVNNLGMLYLNKKKYSSAIIYLKSAQALTRGKKIIDSAAFALSVNNLGTAYLEQKRYKQAKNHYDTSFAIFTKYYGPDNAQTLKAENNLANALQNLGQLKKAISLYSDVLEKQKAKFGNKNAFTLSSLTNLATAYAASGNYDSALHYFEETSAILRDQLISKFSIASEREKEKFANTVEIFFDIYKSYISRLNPHQKKKYSGAIYNNELFLKGLVLSSDEKLKYSVKNSSDSNLMSVFTKWRLEKIYLTRQLNLPTLQRIGNIDSISSIITNLERQLSTNTIFKEYTEASKINWEMLQSHLASNECLIEFFTYRGFDSQTNPTNGTFYSAVVLTKEMQSPEIVPLFSENDLNKIIATTDNVLNTVDKINLLYGTVDDYNVTSPLSNNVKLFNLIWKPLTAYLDNINKVYFSPALKLNTVSLLGLHSEKGDFLIDKRTFVQLPNTKEFLSQVSKEKITFETATLFGGINYDLPDDSLKIWEADPIKKASNSYKFLPQTAVEINTIDSLMKINKLSTQIFKGSNATENNFKAFEGKNIDILHIATHGYFNIKSTKKSDINISSMIDIIGFSKSPLIRSGLILANANYSLNGGKLPLHSENGILTAAEVSNMDLAGTKLLVLSACETGLGDINGSEGIYGLQRAFKMAGVKSIITSLWKISDDFASRFMKLFYKELLSGNSIEDSFHNTQVYLKSNYDPYFWAAFILVE